MRQDTPPRRFKTAVERKVSDAASSSSPGGKRLTFERVDAVRGDNRFDVRGAVVPATGDGRGIYAGAVVPVAWKDGKPFVIIQHHSRRAQNFVARGGGGPLEELFLAWRDDAQAWDVWFRNDQQGATALNLHLFWGATGMAQVAWGVLEDWFFVVDDGGTLSNPLQQFFVFKLLRPGKSIPFGALPPVASLSRIDVVDRSLRSVLMIRSTQRISGTGTFRAIEYTYDADSKSWSSSVPSVDLIDSRSVSDSGYWPKNSAATRFFLDENLELWEQGETSTDPATKIASGTVDEQVVDESTFRILLSKTTSASPLAPPADAVQGLVNVSRGTRSWATRSLDVGVASTQKNDAFQRFVDSPKRVPTTTFVPSGHEMSIEKFVIDVFHHGDETFNVLGVQNGPNSVGGDADGNLAFDGNVVGPTPDSILTPPGPPYSWRNKPVPPSNPDLTVVLDAGAFGVSDAASLETDVLPITEIYPFFEKIEDAKTSTHTIVAFGLNAGFVTAGVDPGSTGNWHSIAAHQLPTTFYWWVVASALDLRGAKLGHWALLYPTGSRRADFLDGFFSPGVPGDAGVFITGPEAVRVAWNAVPGAVFYRVYRSQGFTPGGFHIVEFVADVDETGAESYEILDVGTSHPPLDQYELDYLQISGAPLTSVLREKSTFDLIDGRTRSNSAAAALVRASASAGKALLFVEARTNKANPGGGPVTTRAQYFVTNASQQAVVRLLDWANAVSVVAGGLVVRRSQTQRFVVWATQADAADPSTGRILFTDMGGPVAGAFRTFELKRGAPAALTSYLTANHSGDWWAMGDFLLYDGVANEFIALVLGLDVDGNNNVVADFSGGAPARDKKITGLWKLKDLPVPAADKQDAAPRYGQGQQLVTSMLGVKSYSVHVVRDATSFAAAGIPLPAE